jgi:hypothetical protein
MTPLVFPMHQTHVAAGAIRSILQKLGINPSQRLDAALSLAALEPPANKYRPDYTAQQAMDLAEICRLGGALASIEAAQKLLSFKDEIAHLQADNNFRHQAHILHIAARFMCHGANVHAPTEGADLCINERLVIECKTREDTKLITNTWIEEAFSKAQKQTKRSWSEHPVIISFDWGYLEDYEPAHLPSTFKFQRDGKLVADGDFRPTPERMMTSPHVSLEIIKKLLDKSSRVNAVVISSSRFERNENGGDKITLTPKALWSHIWKSGGKPLVSHVSKKERRAVQQVFKAQSPACYQQNGSV